MTTIATTESPLTGNAWVNKLGTSAWLDVARKGVSGCSAPRPSSSSSESPPTQVTQSPPSPAVKPKSPPHSGNLVASEPASPTASSPSKPPSNPPVKQQQQPSNSDVSEYPERSGVDNVGNAGKKPVWGKPSDCSYKAPAPVMGASLWPDLSECTRPVIKSSVDASPIATDSGFKAAPQETPISKSKRDNLVGKSNSASGHNPGRQRQVRRGGGVNRHSGQPRPPNSQPSNPSTYQEISQNTPAATALPQGVPFVPYTHRPRETGTTIPFSPHPMNGYPAQRNYYRRNNSGPYAHRDDQVPNGWNNTAVWANRGFHPQPRGGGRGFVPTGPAFPCFPPYMGPVPLVRPPGNAFGFPDSPAMMYYVPAPNHFVAMPPTSSGLSPSHSPVPVTPTRLDGPDPEELSVSNQIDYYFSDKNLSIDRYLTSNMDAEGWVPLSLIAGFRRIQSKKVTIPEILEALKSSSIVEVKDERVRRRDGWKLWVPASKLSMSAIQNPSVETTHYDLTSSMKNSSLDEATGELAKK